MSSASNESGESDIEIKSNLQKKKVLKKAPRSPTAGILKKTEPKKTTTKEMVQQAIIALTANTRKGTSMYAIKKFVVENNSIDPVKINYLIKKSIKDGLEKGSLKQMKGTGVTGSFRMAAKKPEQKKVKKLKKESKKIADKSGMVKVKKATEEMENPAKKIKKTKKAVDETKEKPGKKKMTKTADKKQVKISKTVKISKEDKPSNESKKKELKTPSKKKKTIVRRKSIGSIIKPPKMKPKAK